MRMQALHAWLKLRAASAPPCARGLRMTQRAHITSSHQLGAVDRIYETGSDTDYG